MIKFIHSCLNHSNIVCKSIILSKLYLYCIKSTFRSNYKYLSCKYRISHDDCMYTNLSQLVEKVNMKCHEIQHRNAVKTVVELCAIRDGVADCGTCTVIQGCL